MLDNTLGNYFLWDIWETDALLEGPDPGTGVLCSLPPLTAGADFTHICLSGFLQSRCLCFFKLTPFCPVPGSPFPQPRAFVPQCCVLGPLKPCFLISITSEARFLARISFKVGLIIHITAPLVASFGALRCRFCFLLTL